MPRAAKMIGLVLLFASLIMSCSAPKQGEEQIEAWVEEHPELWKGAVDYDSLQVLVQPYAIRDSIEGEYYEIRMNVLEYMDTSRGDGKIQYQLNEALFDSINRARPKVQIGWTCGLGRGEPKQLTLYLGMTYQVDSAYEWGPSGGRKVYH
jgi:hypothetical protein